MQSVLAAAECGSLTKAAERLNYTASGVSQLISAMEGDFGLFAFKAHDEGRCFDCRG